jgi:hypothetical protein
MFAVAAAAWLRAYFDSTFRTEEGLVADRIWRDHEVSMTRTGNDVWRAEDAKPVP